MPNLDKIVEANYFQFSLSAWLAIFHAHWMTWVRSRTKNIPEESEFVYRFVRDGFQCLSKNWGRILTSNNIQLEMASVYCHQHPFVAWRNIKNIESPPKEKVELGDLLICHFHINSKGNSSNSALLLQAKKSIHSNYSLPQNELSQLYLYESLPKFWYFSNKQEKRKIKKSRTSIPLQYLLINPMNHFEALLSSFVSLYNNCLPSKKLAINKGLERALVDLLLNRDGRRFVTQNYPKSDDWAKVVMDLLRKTMPRLLRLSRQGVRGKERGRFYSTRSDLNDDENRRRFLEEINIPPDDYEHRTKDEDGVSTIVIKTRSIE